MKTNDDFLPDTDFDRFLSSALQAMPEFEVPVDFVLRAARLGREQERTELQATLKQQLAQWERRKWWQRGASAVAALLLIGIFYLGMNRLHLASSASSTDTATVEVSSSTTADDGTADSLTSTATTSTWDSPLVHGCLALLGAIALLTIGRSITRQDQNAMLGTPSFS